jgi:hypothetical protein
LIDGEVHHFESGWQPGGGALPMAIDLTVSMNNMVCFDRVFEIHATSPAPAGGFELDCSLDAGKASLRWTNERPEPVARYEILRDGTVVAELDPAARAYEEQAQEGRHLYIVVAVLAAVIVGGGPGGDLFVGSCCVGVEPPAAAVNFIRGDCNGDGEFRGQVTDAVFLLNFNFSSGPEPGCMQACDANGDGGVRGEVSDAVYMLNFNFLGGPPPAAPFPGCGPGELPGDEALGCATPSAGCA